MGYAIGTITKGGGDDCNKQLLGIIKTLAEANGWTTLRYVSTGDNYELILKGVGLSGSEEIFVGFRSYFSTSGDYYNIDCGTFVGYIAGNSFATQPGAYIYSTPAHNNAVTYFITANAQRITGCFKVGTPVYEHFYVGKFFPYARPGEYPSPLVVGAMLDASAATRFDNTSQVFPYPGYRYSTSNIKFRQRDQAGNWIQPNCYPFMQYTSTGNALAGPQGSNTLVPAGSYYQVEPIILYQDDNSVNPSNVWGELDGIYFCSGFNNGVENVVQIGGSSVVDQTGMTVLQAVDAIIAVSGRALVMLQNVYRTSWRDFIAMEMK
ncbi:putative virion structural protein [Pseudomonas phage Guyu]|uniref:Virion structural protein n=1 Tax=Pseudomonas phage Guyu TaxID=2872676 RepID=A0AAE8XBV7_9CAUD|nr:structural protein [Pseudomonas phage Guyu]UAG58603.1 putative virion structural protein [Pseudomonas phage Guyu]UKH49174.1 virion protein [Pseudomonas phage vB_Pae_TR]